MHEQFRTLTENVAPQEANHLNGWSEIIPLDVLQIKMLKLQS